MQEKVTFQNSKGNNLVGILSDPTEGTNNPMMILCHGFSSHKDSKTYLALEERLNSEGVATLRFDFYGHGESDGRFEDITVTEGIDDAQNAIDYLKKRGYKAIGLLGNSYGGLVGIGVGAENPDLFVLILRSPVSHWKEKIESGFTGSYEGLADLEEKGYCYYHGGVQGKKLKLNKAFFDDALSVDGYELAGQIKAPTLIVHGDEDGAVSHKQSVKTAKLIQGVQLEIIKGADHGYSRPEDFERVNDLIVEFIVKHAASN